MELGGTRRPTGFYVSIARNHIPTHTTLVPQTDGVRDVVFKFHVLAD